MAILVCSLETCMVSLHGTCLYCTWMSAGDFVAWGITFLNLSFSHARTKACRNVTKSQCVVYSSMGCHTVILKYMNNETFQMAYFLLDTSVWTCLHVFQTWKFCLRLPHCVAKNIFNMLLHGNLCPHFFARFLHL